MDNGLWFDILFLEEIEMLRLKHIGKKVCGIGFGKAIGIVTAKLRAGVCCQA